MVSFRKICLAALFLWLCMAIILNVLGLNLYFPLNISVTPEEELCRLVAVGFVVGCLLALIFFIPVAATTVILIAQYTLLIKTYLIELQMSI